MVQPSFLDLAETVIHNLPPLRMSEDDFVAWAMAEENVRAEWVDWVANRDAVSIVPACPNQKLANTSLGALHPYHQGGKPLGPSIHASPADVEDF